MVMQSQLWGMCGISRSQTYIQMDGQPDRDRDRDKVAATRNPEFQAIGSWAKQL